VNRRDAIRTLGVALLAPQPWRAQPAAAAGLGFAWSRAPSIAVVGRASDPQ